MTKRGYVEGDYNSLCAHCGRNYKYSEMREEWDNTLACPRCYNTKHPDLDPIIAPEEDTSIEPNSRPRPSFENLTFIDIEGISVLGGVMWNGYDFGTEWTCDEMNVSLDEGIDVVQDFEEIR